MTAPRPAPVVLLAGWLTAPAALLLAAMAAHLVATAAMAVFLLPALVWPDLRLAGRAAEVTYLLVDLPALAWLGWLAWCHWRSRRPAARGHALLAVGLVGGGATLTALVGLTQGVATASGGLLVAVGYLLAATTALRSRAAVEWFGEPAVG